MSAIAVVDHERIWIRDAEEAMDKHVWLIRQIERRAVAAQPGFDKDNAINVAGSPGEADMYPCGKISFPKATKLRIQHRGGTPEFGHEMRPHPAEDWGWW